MPGQLYDWTCSACSLEWVLRATGIDYVGRDGVAEGIQRGALLVDFSSIKPDATRAFAKRLRETTGAGWIDAPVSGGVMGAENGTLVIMAGEMGRTPRIGTQQGLVGGRDHFATGSVLASEAGSPAALLVFRMIMGVGAALIMPSTLSLLTSVLPPAERPKAIAVWTGFAGAGSVIDGVHHILGLMRGIDAGELELRALHERGGLAIGGRFPGIVQRLQQIAAG